MIRHIVSFQFLPEGAGHSKLENMRLAKEKMEALPAQIPFLRAVQVYLGLQDSDPNNFDLTLICDFDNRQDLEAYIVHPAHQALGVFMRQVRGDKARVDVEL